MISCRRLCAAAATAVVAWMALAAGVAAGDTVQGREIQPGISIYVVDDDDTGTTTCTLGWLTVSLTGDVEALTAGHCRTGQQVDVQGNAGDHTELVEAALWKESMHTLRQSPLEGTDIGTVALNPHLRRSARTITGVTPMSVSTSQSLRANPPARICKMGSHTGMTCGPLVAASSERVTFRAAVDHGDSGGPVWAEFRDGTVTAVAIVVGRSDQDPTVTVGQLINPWLVRTAATLGVPR